MPKRKQCAKVNSHQVPGCFNYYARYPRIGFIVSFWHKQELFPDDVARVQRWMTSNAYADFYWFASAIDEPIVHGKTRFPKEDNLNFYGMYNGYAQMTAAKRCLQYFGNFTWTINVYARQFYYNQSRAIAFIVDTPHALNKWHEYILYSTSLNSDIIFIVMQYLIPETVYVPSSRALAKTQAQVPFFIDSLGDYLERCVHFLTQSDQGYAVLTFFEKDILHVLNVSANSLLPYNGLVEYFRFIATFRQKLELVEWAEQNASAWLPPRIPW